mmetsp:Transcript_38555/g.98468  ORF Transcript_38555/g.98468 Transcript_38555/m.98468 type:complete len:298 (+) Transcript_38555:43-936(+)
MWHCAVESLPAWWRCWLLLLLAWPEDEPTGHCGLRHASAQGVHMCHEQCQKCHLFDYDQTWHCLECKTGYELWVDGCFLPCPLGDFRYGYECQPCTAFCNHCVGPMRHECTECARGYKLDMRSVCVRECDDGFFPTIDGSECEKCNAYCKTCISEYRISCTSCFEGYTLRILDDNTSTGECMQNCIAGFYRDASTDLRCIQCGEYCLDCDSVENCFQCQDGATLYRGLCYLEPSFVLEATIDFETYMESGAGLVVPIDDPSAPTWEALMVIDERRRLSEDGMCSRNSAGGDGIGSEQ